MGLNEYPVDRQLPAISGLYADRTVGNIVHPSQKALTAAVYHEAYIAWRNDVSAFDTANVGATITNREAKRAVAVSQPWADKWLTATQDASLAHTQPRSVLTRLGVQRRLGLYLSYAKPLYDSIASPPAATSRRATASATPSSTSTPRPAATTSSTALSITR